MIIAKFFARRSAWCLSVCAAVPVVFAEPATLGELEHTCATALADGYRGVAAAACDWYLDPCAVCGVDPEPVTWCVPPALAPVARAERVVTVLGEYSAERSAPLDAHLPAILGLAFPCAGDQPAARRG